MVDIHHVVPRCLQDHPTLRLYGYEGDYNMIFLPTHFGAERPAGVAHDGGHMRYNAFAKQRLDACRGPHELALLVTLLHRGSRGLCRVPWR